MAANHKQSLRHAHRGPSPISLIFALDVATAYRPAPLRLSESATLGFLLSILLTANVPFAANAVVSVTPKQLSKALLSLGHYAQYELTTVWP
nr:MULTISPECIES: hypothetical protein [Deefgea]